ncbi:hypothetical protein GJAV_G00171790 [Gymnothorax javanicus]|nr:hypothetical protein GJAV_G00171790 [Gymnothorax javanicus]
MPIRRKSAARPKEAVAAVNAPEEDQTVEEAANEEAAAESAPPAEEAGGEQEAGVVNGEAEPEGEKAEGVEKAEEGEKAEEEETEGKKEDGEEKKEEGGEEKKKEEKDGGKKKVKKTVPAWATVAASKRAKPQAGQYSQAKLDSILLEAIMASKDRSGTSMQSILKYISNKYTSLDLEQKKFYLRKTLKRLIDKGMVKQLKGKGMSGSFTVGKVPLKATSDKPVVAPGVKAETLGDSLPLIFTRLCEPKEASYTLIKKYLEQHFPKLKVDRRPDILKTALQKAVGNGYLEQITGKGASGTFQVRRFCDKELLNGSALETAIFTAITAMNEPKSCSTTLLRKFLVETHKDAKSYMLVSNLKRTLNRCKMMGWVEQVTGNGLNGTYQLCYPYYPSPAILFPDKQAPESEDESEEEEDEDESEDEAPPPKRSSSHSRARSRRPLPAKRPATSRRSAPPTKKPKAAASRKSTLSKRAAPAKRTKTPVAKKMTSRVSKRPKAKKSTPVKEKPEPAEEKPKPAAKKSAAPAKKPKPAAKKSESTAKEPEPAKATRRAVGNSRLWPLKFISIDVAQHLQRAVSCFASTAVSRQVCTHLCCTWAWECDTVTRSAEYVGSFPVDDCCLDEQIQRLHAQLRSLTTCKRRRSVSLKFSIKGVKMYDEDETTLLMAHALRRISLSTARPSDAQFAFVSHNPGSLDAQLYCHLFKARHVRAALFLNLLLCRCFQLSYLQKHPEAVDDPSKRGGQLPPMPPSLLNQGFPLSVSALVSFRRAPTQGLLPGEKATARPADDRQSSAEDGPAPSSSSPTLVRKKAIRNKVLRSGAYRSFTYTPHKQRLTQDRLNSQQGKAQEKPPIPLSKPRALSLAETEEALAEVVWSWAGISSDSSTALLAEDVLGSYLLCPLTEPPSCGSLIIRCPSGLLTSLITRTASGKYLLQDCHTEFDSVASIIEHYTESRGELECKLSCARVNHCYEWEEKAGKSQASGLLKSSQRQMSRNNRIELV